MSPDDVVLSLDHVGKDFTKPRGGTLAVLEDITLDIRGPEFYKALQGCGEGTIRGAFFMDIL